ncbi:MAG: plastocyanin/azurin family copper-binding protein [Candidatus Magasanikbacteria bacterium]
MRKYLFSFSALLLGIVLVGQGCASQSGQKAPTQQNGEVEPQQQKQVQQPQEQSEPNQQAKQKEQTQQAKDKVVDTIGSSAQVEQKDTKEQASSAVEKVSQAPDKTISLSNYQFSKTSPSFSKGTVVKFTNKGGTHTVSLDSENINKTLASGDSVTLQFNEKGTYQVYCSFHGSAGSGMHSNIQIGQSGGSNVDNTQTSNTDNTEQSDTGSSGDYGGYY